MNLQRLALSAVILLSAGIFTHANADVSLFTTQQDFAGWTINAADTGFSVNAGSAGDTDMSTVNGVGNLTNPGGTGTAGALMTNYTSTGYDTTYSPDESGNKAFMTAIETGTVITATFDVTSVNSGTYFQPQMYFYSNGTYLTFVTGTNLFVRTGIQTSTFDYTGQVPSGSYNNFTIAFANDSNMLGSYSIDNIRVNAAPEPGEFLALGFVVLPFLRRKK